MRDYVGCEMSDVGGGHSYHRFLKRKKSRLERRRAKRRPDCLPAYRRYRGYAS